MTPADWLFLSIIFFFFFFFVVVGEVSIVSSSSHITANHKSQSDPILWCVCVCVHCSAEVLAAGGARGVAVPSMETASMERARSLPPLHTVKDEVVTVWRGHQIIGSSQTAELELRLAFAPGAGGSCVRL
jgi:hypothetical protein